LRRNKHFNKYLQAAWNKHGENNFSFEVLELVADTSYLIEREQYWIDFLGVYKNGYNLNPNAEGTRGRKYGPDEALRPVSTKEFWTHERRALKSEQAKQRPPEYYQNFRDAQKASITPESIERIKQIGRRERTIADRKAVSEQFKGENHRSAKLTEKQVARIKRQLLQGISRNDIASEHGISTGTVSNIKTGHTWGWVEPEPS
jgi:hypothetical protein